MKRTSRKKIVILSALASAIACAILTAETAPIARAETAKEPAAPAVDQNADRLLKAACKYLADAKTLTFKSEEWRDVVLSNGQKIQTTRIVAIEEKRPGSLHVEVSSPRRSHALWYENKSLTLLDRTTNFFGTVEAPETIDKTVDAIESHFGIEIPMADLLMSDPYASATAGMKSADYLGKVTVLGVSCHHLAFTGEMADWQIWIQAGAKPLIRKIVINQKTKTGSPQFTAILSDWDLQSPLSDDAFTFAPPLGAFKIDFKKVDVTAETTPASQPAK
jgi:hypothetical protein